MDILMDIRSLPGSDLLSGAVDCHVHACPHLNRRSVDVFQAVKAATDAGMYGIGLMDNFSNTSGYAALASRASEPAGIKVFGGLIMEPTAGGVDAACVRNALSLGYAPNDGARFISLPTHHTQHIARQEGRGEKYVAECLAIPERGGLPDPLPEILDLIAEHDVVLNTGHLSGPEAVRLVELSRERGVERILVPCSHYRADEVQAITRAGAYAEFSFFFVSHATQLGLTHVDSERHLVTAVKLSQIGTLIEAATPPQTILSSDCGVYILPPPTEGLREFLLLIEGLGYDKAAIQQMVGANPRQLFKLDDMIV